jgi:hypothetical protein
MRKLFNFIKFPQYFYPVIIDKPALLIKTILRLSDSREQGQDPSSQNKLSREPKSGEPIPKKLQPA